MTQFESFTRQSFIVLCLLGLIAVASGQAAEPVQPGATAAETSAVESSEGESNAESGVSQTGGTRVPERLRHKSRAATAGTSSSASSDGQAPAGSHSVQHHESDLDFVRESAGTKKIPQHTPEWTNPKASDPGRSEPAEKGATANINMGVGEGQAAEGREERRLVSVSAAKARRKRGRMNLLPEKAPKL